MRQSVTKPFAQLLIRRPRPNHGESLRGFALRIDSENTINLFRSRLGSFKEACMALADMEAATGKSLKALLQRVCLIPAQETISAHVNVFGHIVPRVWVTTRVRRVCPLCLNERGFMHANWEVHVIKSCLVHQCHLINQCQSCKALLEWDRGDLFHCRCGAGLCTMKVVPAGRMRVDLDLLISESLNPTIEGKADLWQMGMLDLLTTSGSSRFPEFAVLAGHVIPHIGYAIALEGETAKDEQQAEFALRLIRFGRPCIDAALFCVLGNEMQGMVPRRRAQLLNRSTGSRNEVLQAVFNLNAGLQGISFVQDILFPVWQDVHRRWQASVAQSLAEIESQVIRKAAAARAEARNLRQLKRSERQAEHLQEMQQRTGERQAAWEAKQAAKAASHAASEQKYFDLVLSAYRRDPLHAEGLFRRRWDWFLGRLAKWTK